MNLSLAAGRARRSARAVARHETNGARGATRPTTRGTLLNPLSIG